MHSKIICEFIDLALKVYLQKQIVGFIEAHTNLGRFLGLFPVV